MGGGRVKKQEGGQLALRRDPRGQSKDGSKRGARKESNQTLSGFAVDILTKKERLAWIKGTEGEQAAPKPETRPVLRGKLGGIGVSLTTDNTKRAYHFPTETKKGTGKYKNSVKHAETSRDKAWGEERGKRKQENGTGGKFRKTTAITKKEITNTLNVAHKRQAASNGAGRREGKKGARHNQGQKLRVATSLRGELATRKTQLIKTLPKRAVTGKKQHRARDILRRRHPSKQKKGKEERESKGGHKIGQWVGATRQWDTQAFGNAKRPNCQENITAGENKKGNRCRPGRKGPGYPPTITVPKAKRGNARLTRPRKKANTANRGCTSIRRGRGHLARNRRPAPKQSGKSVKKGLPPERGGEGESKS